MIKVDIITRQNLTMLAKAYWDKLLPRALDGEIFYSKNEKNEPQFIYYENQDYYFSLLKYIEKNQNDFFNSNAANAWNELFSAISEYTVVENVDFGFLENYTMPVETNNKERAIDLDIIHTNDNSFYRQVKRLYRGYDVKYWGSDKNIVIPLPIDPDEKTVFDLHPLIQLLESHKQTISKFDFFRDPKIHTTVIRISVE
jgi:transposase